MEYTELITLWWSVLIVETLLLAIGIYAPVIAGMFSKHYYPPITSLVNRNVLIAYGFIMLATSAITIYYMLKLLLDMHSQSKIIL